MGLAGRAGLDEREAAARPAGTRRDEARGLDNDDDDDDHAVAAARQRGSNLDQDRPDPGAAFGLRPGPETLAATGGGWGNAVLGSGERRNAWMATPGNGPFVTPTGRLFPQSECGTIME
jgi:hypothetical protein